MVKFLVYLKHHLTFIWDIIELINSFIFNLLFGKKVNKCLPTILENISLNQKYKFKLLEKNEMSDLAAFFERQPEESFKFFVPHKFDEKSLVKKNRDKSFIMIGVYDGPKIIGYCFLRCFFNKQAFRGKIVDKDYQGQGLAKKMGILTTLICKEVGLRLFATISKDNVKSIASSKAVNDVRIVKEISDGYLYVEYLLKDNNDNA